MASSRPSQTFPNGQGAATPSHDGRLRTEKPAVSGESDRPACPQRGPLTMLLDLFSSIWLGVTLLAILFIYSSVGSAGILYPSPDGWVHEQIRQWRGLEMTEFEWFHWWPFDLLIALICTNLVIATLRRIPFSALRLGVWMIHSGIIILAVGSVIYFSTKVEGDAPVARRMVQLSLEGEEPVEVVASPGQSAMIGRGSDAYFVTVSRIDPQWEILTGADAGERAYSVFLDVIGPDQQFTRQLLAGYPQLTEDLIRTDDPEQPMQRARKVTPDASPLVDKRIGTHLAYAPQEYMYLNVDLRKDWAIYLREAGQTQWVQRPINGVPKYNEYISSPDAVFASSDFEPPVDPLDVAAQAVEEGDPLPETVIRIRQYLPFAVMETRRGPGGGQLNPIVQVRVQDEAGRVERYELLAFDPQSRTAEAGAMTFLWADSLDQRDAMRTVRDPILHIHVPESSIEQHVPIAPPENPDAEMFTPIEGTDYSYRVRRYEDGLPLPGGRDVAVAIVEIHSGERTFERWVFDEPSLNRDLTIGTGEDLPRDEAIEMRVERGTRPAPITLIGGPAHDDLHLLLNLPDGTQRFEPIEPGQPAALQGDVSLVVDEFAAHSIAVTRPRIIPLNQRERDLRNVLAMINVEIPVGGRIESLWLPFHLYPFENARHALRRFPYRPEQVALPDGRVIELMFSRRRINLPAPVVLDDFAMTTHEGGFTGSTLSVLNWTSMVRFDDGAGSLSDARSVSVNNPVEHHGFWYFQAMWDPPQPASQPGDTPSLGLNYTVLGVGNRNGVLIQLLGCCIAVTGMIYTFYIKPIIRRRRESVVRAAVAAKKVETRRAAGGRGGRKNVGRAAAGASTSRMRGRVDQ